MNPLLNLPQLLDDAHAIARAAGEAILAVYETDFSVSEKPDHSPLTEADIAAHRLIVAGLARLDPVLPCLSEEGVDIPFAQRSAWDRYWLVDPLDGTREFVNRSDEFTVNIALIENGIPILGVVHAPKLDVAYLAARGLGAQRLRDGDRTPIHARRTPPRPRLVVSRFHRTAELEAMLTRLPPHEAVTRGSSLKFCLVAEGSADCYPRTGPTSEWDTAAGQCVVEQAGGQVLRTSDWAPLVYNRKPSLINPGFAVIGDLAWGWPQRLTDA